MLILFSYEMTPLSRSIAAQSTPWALAFQWCHFSPLNFQIWQRNGPRELRKRFCEPGAQPTGHSCVRGETRLAPPELQHAGSRARALRCRLRLVGTSEGAAQWEVWIVRGPARLEQRVCVKSGGGCRRRERRVRAPREGSAGRTERVEGERRGHRGLKRFGACAREGAARSGR